VRNDAGKIVRTGDSKNRYSFTIISDDHGKSWRIGSKQVQPYHTTECSVAQSFDGGGDLYMYTRIWGHLPKGWGALLHNVRLYLVAHQRRRFDERLGRKDAKVCGAQGTSLKITVRYPIGEPASCFNRTDEINQEILLCFGQLVLSPRGAEIQRWRCWFQHNWPGFHHISHRIPRISDGFT
jgi:hypothetical protein